MRLRKGLLADVAGTLATEVGAIAVVLGFWPFEPQRCIFRGAALDAQSRRRASYLPVVLLGRLALGAPKALAIFTKSCPSGLRRARQTSECRGASCVRTVQVRSVRLDCTKHAHVMSVYRCRRDRVGGGVV